MSTTDFDIKSDGRGSLVSIEAGKNIPFNIKRVYYIFNTKEGVERGFHAHKTLQQILVCVSGSCTIVLDNGIVRKEYLLDKPNVGLYIGPSMWREMKNFSSGSVLLVLASAWYEENDYIRNYHEFIEFSKKGR